MYPDLLHLKKETETLEKFKSLGKEKYLWKLIKQCLKKLSKIVQLIKDINQEIDDLEDHWRGITFWTNVFNALSETKYYIFPDQNQLRDDFSIPYNLQLDRLITLSNRYEG